MSSSQNSKHSIKCVVWDLDNTLWDGVLLENDQVYLRDGIFDIIKTLDSRGILQSIASRNDENSALSKLQEFGLQEYFLYPQINWNSKVASVKTIGELINIGLDTILFIDDQIIEREEMSFSLPEVLCLDADCLDRLLDMPGLNPRFITEDSRMRRLMYLSDLERNKAEEQFIGPKEEFLSALDMRFVISPATEDDLKRAEELTLRTNQLNTTGYTYSYEELNDFRQSKCHKLLTASLVDKYGSYGKIGLALIECHEDRWVVKLLLMSCRVMSRGVGMVMLNHIMRLAGNANVRLLSEFIPNDRNRMMRITFNFAGFREIERIGGMVIFENDLSRLQPFPEYLKVQIVD